MADKKQLNFPFTGGLNEKLAEQYLDPNQNQVSITNGNFTKVGVVDKRLGLEHLSSTVIPGGSAPSLATGTRLAAWSHSDLSILQAGAPGPETGVLYTYSSPYGGPVGVAQLPACTATRRPVTAIQSGAPPLFCDFEYNGRTVRASAFYAEGPTPGSLQVDVSVYDVATGDLILEPTVTQVGTLGIQSFFYQPTAPVGHQVNLFLEDYLVTGNIWCWQYNPVTNAWTNAGIVATAGAFPACDIVPNVNDPRGNFIIAYKSPALGVQQINIEYHLCSAPTVAFGTTTITRVNEIIFPIYVAATYSADNSESLWVGWTEQDGAGNYTYWVNQYSSDYSLVLELGGPVIMLGTGTTGWQVTGLCRVDASHYVWTAGRNYTESPQGYDTVAGYARVMDNTGNLVSEQNLPLGYIPTNRPFTIEGQIYQACYFCLYQQSGTAPSDTHSQQVTIYLLKWTQPMVNSFTFGGSTSSTDILPIATVAPRQVYSSGLGIIDFSTLGKLPFMSGGALINNTRQAMGVITNGPDTAAVGGVSQQNWAIDFTFDAASNQNLYQTAELGQELHISGGVPFDADSLTAFEDNFFYYPEFSYITLDGSTSTFTGTYSYFVEYRYVDAAGLTHKSAPYPLGTVTPVAGEAINIHITPYVATWRDLSNPGSVFADIYRTTNLGSTFFFMTTVNISGYIPSAIGQWPPIVYGPDTTDDNDLQVASILYITGGVLDNINAPAAAFQCTHRNRLAIVDETLRNVWFSKQFTTGDAPGFNEALVVSFSEGGDITAIASLDDKFVCYKQHSIWIMYGDGPTITGQSSDWTIPQKVASDVGCISWQSVILTPVGLMFQAENGIYLLDRGLTVSFIGVNVIDTLTDFPTITSSCLVPKSTQVRFTCSNGTQSVTIVYDYLLKQWTTHVYGQLTAPVASACATYGIPSQYTILCTDGTLWQERLPTDPNAYYDSDASDVLHFVPTSVSTAWVKVQLQNYQQMNWVQFFGIQGGACGLQLDLAVNYDDTVVQSSVWQDTDLANLPIPGQVQFYTAGQYNMCMAAQVTVTDLAPGTLTGTGQGMKFVGLLFDFNTIGSMYVQVPQAGRR